MNETIETIYRRKSVRSYGARQVSEQDMKTIVEAGLQAPSGMNVQAWHVTVVRNMTVISRLEREMRRAIIDAGVERYVALAKNPDYNISYGAPTFVLVSADPSASMTALQDCSLVIGTMFIAAESIGVSSCWINQPPAVAGDPEFKALLTELGIPPEQTLYAAAAFGYAASEGQPKPSRRGGTVNFVN